MGSGVLAVLFLVFNEVYLATGPDTFPYVPDLAAEAIRLNGNQSGLIPHDVVQLLTVGTALSSAEEGVCRISATAPAARGMSGRGDRLQEIV
jgi:predicted RNA polymerase sigma factor